MGLYPTCPFFSTKVTTRHREWRTASIVFLENLKVEGSNVMFSKFEVFVPLITNQKLHHSNNNTRHEAHQHATVSSRVLMRSLIQSSSERQGQFEEATENRANVGERFCCEVRLRNLNGESLQENWKLTQVLKQLTFGRTGKTLFGCFRRLQ